MVVFAVVVLVVTDQLVVCIILFFVYTKQVNIVLTINLYDFSIL